MKVNDPGSLQHHLNSCEYGQDISGLNGDQNPDLCDSGAVIQQLNYQANWELVVMWINNYYNNYYKPTDDGYRSLIYI